MPNSINTQQKNEIIDWLLEEGNNFCTLPFAHLAIEADGNLLPCCQGQALKEPDGSDVNIKNYDSINELINHPSRQEMITAFKKNQQFKNCHRCWKDTSKFSPRINFSTSKSVIAQTYEYMAQKKNDVPIKADLTWLEIKLGNKCNLKCRICGTINSSSWAKDDFQLQKQNETDKYSESKQFQFNQDCLWINDLKYYKNIEGLKDLKTIHIMGGEPLMVKEHFELLDELSRSLNNGELTIWYNTNGTQKLKGEHLEILNRFAKIQWSLSIDDIGDRFEYQRRNAKWENTKENINYFHELASKHRQHKTVMDATVSIYNILYLQEIVETFAEQKWNFYPFNHFVKTGINSVRSLTPVQKSHVQGQISQLDMNQKVIEFIDSKDLWSEKIDTTRKNTIKKLDLYRKESFAKVFPEMNQILEIY